MTVHEDSRIERHIDIREGGKKALDWLAEGCCLSRAELKTVMHKGAVWLTRGKTSRIRRSNKILKYGDQLHLYYDPKVLEEEPQAAQLISDQGNYSVWYKPFGMRCQGSKYGDHCTLYRWAESHMEPERTAYTVHRLDRATEGLILLAHDKATTTALASQFENREVEKRYRARVHGILEFQDELVDEPVNGKSARSRMTTLAVDADKQQSLIEILLETGRKHQIRQHLSGMGFPIVGDRLYGQGVADGVDLQLQSFLLKFRCPNSDTQLCFMVPEQQLLSLS
ncbi:MAG: RNA pseudouridine synthase [Motiliproteus sp.]